MEIDLKTQFSKEDVRKLIASKDDSIDRQLRVTNDGIAYLSDIVGGQAIEGLRFRLETWDAGNDYLGHQASMDEEWVNRIYNALCKHWPNPASTYIDFF